MGIGQTKTFSRDPARSLSEKMATLKLHILNVTRGRKIARRPTALGHFYTPIFDFGTDPIHRKSKHTEGQKMARVPSGAEALRGQFWVLALELLIQSYSHSGSDLMQKDVYC